MAKTKVLLTVERVIDCDTGDYQVGETDFGIHLAELESYLKAYRHKGRDRLIQTLGYLIYAVETEFRRLPIQDEAAQSTTAE